jgi:cbb3-type cytochrome oxidase subunit 3
MKTILFIALIAIMLTTGFAAATDMTMYDSDKNGVIDAAERLILDIDIEGCRLTPGEILVIDTYTMGGTIILSPEFQAAFLNPDARIRDETPVVTVIPEPIYEEPPVLVVIDEPEPVVEEIVNVDEDVGGNLTVLFVVGMILIAGVIVYIYSKQNDQE